MSLIGVIVEPPAPLIADSASPARQPGMDFTIGGLSFKVLDTDQQPYQRQTAQFRKDQFDTSPEYSDQSLVGYWTRGEFSFHRGDGVKFYEVSDPGNAVEYRYWQGSGVDPTVPGVVTAYDAWSNSTISSGTVANYVEVDSGKWALLDGGSIRTFGGTVATLVASCLTASATQVFAAVGADVYVVDPTAGTASKIYTAPHSLVFITWAKSRLFGITSVGECYEMVASPASPPVTLGSSDLVFTLPDSSGPWSAMETPGSVFLGNGSNIYALTVDTSGATPDLAAPVLAAQLPPGESVVSMGYNLGFALLLTTSGIRPAEVQDSSILFGPVIVDGTPGVGAVPWRSGVMTVLDGAAWFVDFNHPVNVSQTYGTAIGLEYAHHQVQAGAFASVAASPADGAPRLLTAAQVWKQSAAPASGYLQTGLHRFATMEPKKFQTVRVRASGTGGFVEVSKVSASGAVTSLYTMDLSSQDDVVLGLGEPTPIESLGIRFDLIPNGGVAPSLLGYQLKALPCPQRQRIISIAVMCYDHEVRPSAPRTGHLGASWEKLNALENMEASGGTFQFTDWRTGETGECYIDQLQFQSTTPPSAKGSGFGGAAILTLRKL